MKSLSATAVPPSTGPMGGWSCSITGSLVYQNVADGVAAMVTMIKSVAEAES